MVKSTLLVTVYQFTILVKHTIYDHCCAKYISSCFLFTLALYLYIKVEKLKYKGSLTLVSSHGYHIPCCYITLYTLARLLIFKLYCCFINFGKLVDKFYFKLPHCTSGRNKLQVTRCIKVHV